MVHIESCATNEEGKYKLIDANGNVVKIYTDADEPVDFNKEVEKYTATHDYRELRKAEYPEIEDQLDAIWEILTPPAGSKAETMKQKIEGVKAKHPQPKE